MNKISSWIAAGILALGLTTTASADALTAKPMRVGPVQNYGALGTSGNQVVSLVNGKQVMLRGMSFFWSDALGLQYYKKEVVKWAAENLGVDVIRFAMGIEYYDNGSQKMDENYSYKGNPDGYKSKIDQMVEAAIENDIYIIIDWHSHRAHQETSDANAFFAEMAQKYANVPNVIYEVYNEPIINSWETIKSYAQTVVGSIRSYTQNLVLVGTGFYSQNPGTAAANPLSNPNVAYVLHFYAGTHSKGSFSSTIESALNNNQAVFISEWGTTNADGDGEPNSSATQEWFTYMDSKKISNCNWSLRQYTSDIDNTSEKSAMFDGSEYLTTQEALNNAKYTTSGSIVKEYLTKNMRSWADSLVAGKTGTCSFKTQTVKETDGAITNALNAGCTYTSSDESVASANGSTIEIKSAGFAIFTGNDNSQSIVIVQEEPSQSITGVVDFTCRYNGSCTQSHTLADLTGSGKSEAVLTANTKTNQGGTFTLTSLNPDVVDVKYAACTTDKCYGSKGAQVYMCEFKQFGDAKVVATAPAVTGYRAMNDTITITYAKGQQRIHSKFKDQVLAFGEATGENAMPTTMIGSLLPITYTFNGQPTTPYITQVGTTIVAGNQNAVVLVKASAPGNEYYEDFEKSITVIVGDSALAVNKEEFNDVGITPIAKPEVGLKASISNGQLVVLGNSVQDISVNIFSVTGQKVMSKILSSETPTMSLATVARGSYLVVINQGSKQVKFKWNNK